MTFEIGEKVVYPNQGVGTIENISTRSFGSQLEKFYLLRLVYSSMTVMVPFSNVGNIGLRKITKTNEISRVLNYLATGDCINCSDWKYRFKVNSDKMQSGNLLQIAEVLKGLLILQADKPLSFREKKMLERARHMMVSEFAIAKGVPQVEAVTLLQKSLSKSGLNLPEASFNAAA
jgi:CarD family transcriptional regulator